LRIRKTWLALSVPLVVYRYGGQLSTFGKKFYRANRILAVSPMLFVGFIAVAKIKFMNSHRNRLPDAEGNQRSSRGPTLNLGQKASIPCNKPVAGDKIKVYAHDSLPLEHRKNTHAPLAEQRRQYLASKSPGMS